MPLGVYEPSCDVCGKKPAEHPRGQWFGTAEGHAFSEVCVMRLLDWVIRHRALGDLPADIMDPTLIVGRSDDREG